MKRSKLERLCQALDAGRSVTTFEYSEINSSGVNWLIRLFNVGTDEEILVRWSNGEGKAAPGISLVQDALQLSFELIQGSPKMQAFVVWKADEPIMQIDVEDANDPLGVVCVPFDGAYAMLSKFADNTAREDLETALLFATQYFFTFEEVIELYLPIADELEDFITVALESGFREVWINENRGKRLFVLGRAPRRIVLDGPGPYLI